MRNQVFYVFAASRHHKIHTFLGVFSDNVKTGGKPG